MKQQVGVEQEGWAHASIWGGGYGRNRCEVLDLMGCSLELLRYVEDMKGTRGPSVSGLSWQSWLGYRQAWLGTVSASSPGVAPQYKGEGHSHILNDVPTLGRAHGPLWESGALSSI